ncbi:unnamed protein product [Camellia sinensis]
MANSTTQDAISSLLANPSPESSSQVPEIVVQVLDLKSTGSKYILLIERRLLLEPECVNNINHFDGLIINTLIFTTTFGRRVSTNVYINCSLNNPLPLNFPQHSSMDFLVWKRIREKLIPGKQERFTASDGKMKLKSLLQSSLSSEVMSGNIQNLGPIRILYYAVNDIPTKNEKFLIVIKCEVVSPALEAELKAEGISEESGIILKAKQGMDLKSAVKSVEIRIILKPKQELVARSVAQIVLEQNGNMAPSARMAMTRVHPLVSLNPYHGNWTIKVAVTGKGNMRTYKNAGGEGYVFNVELTDEDGTQIQATMFNEAAKKFYDKFQLGKVYYISKGTLKVASKQFKTVQNDYEMTLNANSAVEEASDEATFIPETKFNFVLIGCQWIGVNPNLIQKSKAVYKKSDPIIRIHPIRMRSIYRPTIDQLGPYVNSKELVDVIGVVQNVSPTLSIRRKINSETIPKHDITIADETVFKEDLIHIDPFPSEVPSAKYISTVPPALVSSSPPASPLVVSPPSASSSPPLLVYSRRKAPPPPVSLWNDPVTNIGQELLDISDKFPIVAIKSLKVGDFQGVSLSALSKSIVVVNPDTAESRKLRSWYDCEGEVTSMASIGSGISPATNNGMRSMYSDRVPLPHITHNPSLGEEKPVFFSIKVYISLIKPDQTMWYRACKTCNKKVTEAIGSGYWCEGCQKNDEECSLRKSLMQAAKLSVFNEQAEIIVGCSADELDNLKSQEGEKHSFQQKLKEVTWVPHIFRVSVTPHEYMNEKRQRITVRAVGPVDFAAESRFLLEEISKMKVSQ